MKKYFIVMIMCSSFTLFAQPKDRAAVAQFKVSGELTTDDASTLRATFQSALAGTKIYQIVELDDQELNQVVRQYESGVFSDNDQSVQLGIASKANYIFTGRVSKFGEAWTATIQKIDLSERTLEGDPITVRYEGRMEDLLEQLEIAAQKIAGVYEESGSTWYYVGGAILVGGGAAAVVLGGKKGAEALVGTDGLPNPPAKPN